MHSDTAEMLTRAIADATAIAIDNRNKHSLKQLCK
jgi:hypothetical protein